MPLLALPAGHEVQHVHALVRLAVLLALLAAELDAARREERAVRRGVHHLDEPRVEVDLGGERRDGHERGVAHTQDRRHGFIEEALVAVRRLLEDEHVAAGALRGADLEISKNEIKMKK